MWIVDVIILAAAGLLGASNFIIEKQPNAATMIEKIRPLQGIIGIILLIWGIWSLFHLLRGIGLVTSMPLWWLLYLVATAAMLGLGYLLSIGLLGQLFLGSNPQMMQRAEQMRAQLAPYQVPLGLAAIVVALIWLFMNMGR